MPITFSSLAPFDPLARITLIVIPLSSTITFVQRSPPPPNLISSVHTPISHLSIFQPPFHSYLWKPSGNRNFNRERGFFTKVFPPRFLLSRVSGRRDRENIDKREYRLRGRDFHGRKRKTRRRKDWLCGARVRPVTAVIRHGERMNV